MRNSGLKWALVAKAAALVAAGPGNYYSGINTNENGPAFTQQLTALISQHSKLSYADLWTAFKTTDIGARDGNNCTSNQIADIYSSTCWVPGTDQCGSYSTEGDCYNREHSWPKSAWNGSEIAAYTDLMHLYPSDGYDNGRRSNYWLGFVDPNKVTYETDNGSKLGTCVAASMRSRQAVGADEYGADLPSICWEPADAVKGLLARSYFYISVSYADTFTCCDTDGTNGATIKPWMLATLLDWHNAHPITAAEQARHEAVNSLQGNRNPFIDYPEWVQKVFESGTYYDLFPLHSSEGADADAEHYVDHEDDVSMDYEHDQDVEEEHEHDSERDFDHVVEEHEGEGEGEHHENGYELEEDDWDYDMDMARMSGEPDEDEDM